MVMLQNGTADGKLKHYGPIEFSQESENPLLLKLNLSDEGIQKGGKQPHKAGCDAQEVWRCVMLVVATFIAHLLSTGMSYSSGVFYVEFLAAFNQGNGVTSLISSLNFGALCAVGPLSSIVIKKLDCANTIIIGGLISSLGIFMCYFAGSVYFVLATFGVITGVGYGLVFAASLTQINCHIHHLRSLCTGVSMAGTGIGMVINPMLTEYLVRWYTWRGALLIISALTMNICVSGFVIRLTYGMESTRTEQMEVPLDTNQNTKSHLANAVDKVPEKDFSALNTISATRNSMWRNPLYWSLHINIILFCFGQSIVFTHMASFAFTNGLTQMESSSLISIVGVTVTIGRILWGSIANIPKVNASILHVSLIALEGLFTLCFTFSNRYLVMATFLSLLGICLSEFGPVLSEVCIDILGIQHFTRGYGFLLISMAFGTLLGAPSAGKLYDYTNVYENSFYLSSAIFILSALVFGATMFVHHILKTIRKK